MVTAPCSDVPELMFTPGVVATEAATRLCARCPLTDRCRELGTDATWGVWAGEQKGQTAGFLLLDQPEPVVEVVHGKRGTGCTCLRCKAAHARYVAEWRRRDVTPAAASTAGDQLNLWEMTA